MKKEIVIVGGGAAGLMAAISASGEGTRVTVLEQNEKVGKKLYITGKGRCNVTNACPPEELGRHIPTNPKFLYSAFAGFSNQDMRTFLEREGLKLKVERGMRVFPASDHASDVIRTLEQACRKRNVRILLRTRVKGICADAGHVIGVRLSDGREMGAAAVILACGGLSYPSTGANGSGYALAKALGHTVVEPQPSLVPLVMAESWCRDLMGLSLRNVGLSLKTGKKKIYEGFGEMLFTHFGVSGPLVLTASTRLGKYQTELQEGRIALVLDLKPALSAEQLERRFLRELDTYRNRTIPHVLETMLPKKMVPVFLDKADIPSDRRARDVSKGERHRMEDLLKCFKMQVKGVRPFGEAIITRGGIPVREIDPKTMRSKRMEGLYFAGEMIDVDAETGGFNLQIAWSTGAAAGRAAKSAVRFNRIEGNASI